MVIGRCYMVYNRLGKWRYELYYYWGIICDCLRNKRVEIKATKERLKEDGSVNIAEKKELITRIKAMSEEEMMVALDHIPVDLCLRRVNAELKRLYALENSLVGLIKRD